MPAPAIYLDECVDERLVDRLQRRGLRVTSVRLADQKGNDDAAQLRFATQHGLLLVSHNMRDFRRLHRSYHERGRPHAGIALLPYAGFAEVELRLMMMLDWIATFPDHGSQLFRWHDLQQWLIQGNRLPGYSEAEVRRALGQSA
jgi:hypothetical protein